MKEETKNKIGEVVAMIAMFPLYVVFTPVVFIMHGVFGICGLWKIYFKDEESEE